MGAYCCDCWDTRDPLELKCGVCGTDQPKRGWPRDMLLGITIAGRFRVIGRSAESSLGVVYRAQDQDADMQVAVRSLHSRYHADERMVSRFRREVDTVQKLQCEHTARVLAVVDEPGVIGYVTETLDTTLEELLNDHEVFDPGRAVHIARQIAVSLAEAHKKNIAHHELGPRNILVSQDSAGRDFVKVHGYGISAVRETSTVSSRPERDTSFIAPEQVRQQRPGPASDVYALGTLLFRLVSGKLPFDDPDPMVVLRLKAQHPAPSLKEASTGASPDLVEIVNGMLAREPGERRPATAREAVDALEGAAKKLGLQPLPPQGLGSVSKAMPASTKSGRSGPVRAGPIALGALFGIVLGGVLAITLSDPPASPPPPDQGPAPAIVNDPGPSATASPGQATGTETALPTAVGEPAVPSPAQPEVAPGAQPVVAQAPRAPVPTAPQKPADPGAAIEPGPAPMAQPAPAVAPVEPLPVAPSVKFTPELRLGHGGVVRAMAYSSDGRWFVTGADDRTLHVVDTRTGKRVRKLSGLTGSPSAIALSSDARLIAAGAADGTLMAWTPGQNVGRVVKTLKGGVRAMGFTPDGSTLLVADQTRTLHHLRTDDLSRRAASWKNAQAAVKLGRGTPAYIAALSGDGNTLVSADASAGPRLVLRNTQTGKVATEIETLPNVTRVVADFTGRWIVAASSEGKIQLIELGQTVVVRRIDHGAPITALAIHPKQPLLASGGAGGTVKLWDLTQGKALPFAGKLVGEPSVSELAFHPTARILSAAGTDFQLRDFDLDSGAVLGVRMGSPSDGAPLMAFSDDGRRLALASSDGSLHVFDLATGDRTARVDTGSGVAALTFVPASLDILVASTDGTLARWHGPKALWAVALGDVIGDLTSNGTEIVACSLKKKDARRFDAATGKELPGRIKSGGMAIRTARFAPAGKHVAVGGARGQVALFELGGAKAIRKGRFLPGRGQVSALAWAKGGAALAAAFDGGGLLVYRVPASSARPPALQTSGMTPVRALHIDGDRVTGGAEDGSIRRWNWRRAEPEPVPRGWGETAGWALSGNGGIAAAADSAGRVRLVKFAPGSDPVLTLFTARDAWLAFTPRARYVGNVAGLRFLSVRDKDTVRPAVDVGQLRDPAAVSQALSRLKR